MQRSTPAIVAKRSTLAIAVAIASTIGASTCAYAISIDTGNPDINMRLDNTVRYTAGWRVEGQDSSIYKNSSYDESDLKFDRGDMVQNRIDVLTEFDMTYQNRMGFRVSAATWYDDAYKDDDVKTYKGSTLPTSYDNDNYSGTTERYYRGLSGEILDAFVFSRFDLGDVPLNVRLGRHTIFWGEGLLFPGHAVSYSQAPVDGRKAAANPGSETKEIFLPIGQISGQAQVTQNLSLAAQYFYEWDPTRAPEGGTYFGSADFGVGAPDRFPVALNPITGQPILAKHVDNKEPKQGGNWGVAARYNIESFDATAGLYYRVFDDYTPGGLQILTSPFQVFPGFSVDLPSAYRFVHVENTKLIGASLTKQIGEAAVGMDLSYRHGTGLNTRSVGADDKPAIGNTWHFVTNAVWILGETPLYNTGSLITELAYSHLDKVTHNEDLFAGDGYATCEGQNKWDGCSTRDFVGVAVNFSPQWLQVWPNIDLELPMTVNHGLYGNAASGGGNQGATSYSIGIKATYDRTNELILRYADQYAHAHYDDNNVVNGGNGSFSLADRGWVSLTLKTGF